MSICFNTAAGLMPKEKPRYLDRPCARSSGANKSMTTRHRVELRIVCVFIFLISYKFLRTCDQSRASLRGRFSTWTRRNPPQRVIGRVHQANAWLDMAEMGRNSPIRNAEEPFRDDLCYLQGVKLSPSLFGQNTLDCFAQASWTFATEGN